jgi:uncharacterized protein
MVAPLPPVSAASIIAALNLSPHPEGGWYRETWRGPPGPDGRAVGTAIFYLLAAGERSHWHRVDANEHWIFNAGAPLLLSLSDGHGMRAVQLGADVLAGDAPHARVVPGEWQAAQSLGDWTLCTCTVSPGFDFAGFEMAPPGWQPA